MKERRTEISKNVSLPKVRPTKRSNDIVIINAVRTPFSQFGGALREVSSRDLGAIVIREVLQRVGLDGKVVDEVYFGMCVQAEAALENNVIGRQAILTAGLPAETLSLTIDRACCSSLTGVQLGIQSIKLGRAEVVLSVGAENMGRAAFLLPGPEVRWERRIGDIILEDRNFEIGYKGFGTLAVDAGEVAIEYGITRQEQDEWAYWSHKKFLRAQADGKFEQELVPVEVPEKNRAAYIFKIDECPRPDTTLEKLAKLPTVYSSPTITAGNAPGISTGASAVLFMTRKKAETLRLKPVARILAVESVATNPRMIAAVPAMAIQKALTEVKLGLDRMDLIEINEAFAAMPLVSTKILANEDPKVLESLRAKTNVNGGAIAVGHPVGASGCRILMTLMYELKRRSARCGVCAICGGLGQGDAAVIQNE